MDTSIHSCVNGSVQGVSIVSALDDDMSQESEDVRMGLGPGVSQGNGGRDLQGSGLSLGVKDTGKESTLTPSSSAADMERIMMEVEGWKVPSSANPLRRGCPTQLMIIPRAIGLRRLCQSKVILEIS